MIMTSDDIKAAIEAEDIAIEPLSDDNFKPLAYVARLGKRTLLGGEDAEINTETRNSITIAAGQFVLFTTLERFKLNEKIAGHLGIRSQLARKGFILLAGMHIDPRWDGHLVLGGYNASPRNLVLDYTADVVSIEFYRLAKPATILPPISAELQQGRLPEFDKDYLRSMETQSLSQLGEEIRKLSQSVAVMSTQIKYIGWAIGIGFAVLSILNAVLAILN